MEIKIFEASISTVYYTRSVIDINHSRGIVLQHIEKVEKIKVRILGKKVKEMETT